MQVFRSSGREDDFVRSLVSVVEMLPTTFEPLSRTAREETPSSRRSASASARGRSPLPAGQLVYKLIVTYILDGDWVVRTDFQIPYVLSVGLFNHWKVSTVLPEKAHKTGL